MKILIVGEGLGGLSLSLLLKRSGHSIEIVEQRGEKKVGGFIVLLWPNGLRLLRLLRIRIPGYPVYSFEEFYPTGKSRGRYYISPRIRRYGLPTVVIRQDLHDALLKKTNGITVRRSSVVRSLRQDNRGITVKLSNDEVGRYDYVIGADGVNSSIRKFAFPKAALKSTSWNGWWLWVNMILPGKNFLNAWSNEKFFAIFPTRMRNRWCVYAGARAKYMTKRNVDLKSYFQDFSGIVPRILKKLPPDHEIFSGPQSQITLPRWHRGRIILMGDAAHAVSPSTGIGASLAFEDAALLAQAFRSKNPDQGIRKYETVMKRRSRSMQKNFNTPKLLKHFETFIPEGCRLVNQAWRDLSQ